MSLNRTELVMFHKKAGKRSLVNKKIVDAETGNTENPPSQLFDLLIEMSLLPCVNQKIKLHPVSVQVTVKIHDTAFRTTKLGVPQNMQYSNWLFHMNPHFFLSTENAASAPQSSDQIFSLRHEKLFYSP